MTTENDWECRAKRRIENDDGDIDGRDATYYNDDAFGLVFLSASLVSRDFSFAGSFMLLSSIAAATVNNTSVANIKKFQPVLPGIVAFAALVASKIEPFAAAAQLLGGDFVVPLDERGSQLQLIVCSISLVWGIIQQMRSGEGEGKFELICKCRYNWLISLAKFVQYVCTNLLYSLYITCVSRIKSTALTSLQMS